MFKLNFVLKQHTPIIHFQHEQEGATLRATEVKPKLDRYIIENCGGKASMNKDWFNNFDRGSLDYKLKIEKSNKEDVKQRIKFEEYYDPNSKTIKFKVKRNSTYPMVLANMASKNFKEEFKDFRFFDNLECSIFCLNPDLEKKISLMLGQFFGLNNFGNRNNKGFGSFSLININGKAISWDETHLPKGTAYLKIDSIEPKKIFETIDFFYKWLKSGINYSYDKNAKICHVGRYYKSVLFQYLESIYPTTITLGENWEKKWIKESYLSLPVLSPPKYISKYYRALLGLSDKHTFTKAECNKDVEFVSILQLNLYKKELQNLHFNSDIDRIKSPYTFKVIEIAKSTTKVYILIDKSNIDEIYSRSLNKTFTFFIKNEFKIRYDIGPKNYDLNFKYTNNNLNELDDHLNRLKLHLSDLTLRSTYNQIKKYKNEFQTIELPNTPLDYKALIDYFSSTHPRFKAKDFKWKNILDSDIEILKT